MKVLYLPLNSPEVTQTGMYDGFIRAGANLKVFDFNMMGLSGHVLNSKLIQEAISFEPDLIHAQFQFTEKISPDIVFKIKEKLPNTTVTQWTGDVRATVQDVFVKMAHAVDISLVSSSGQVDMYKEATNGADIRYWQIGYDPKKYYQLNNTKFKYDISFAASNHTSAGFPGASQRQMAARILKDTFDKRFGLFGYGWGKKANYVPQIKMNEIYNDSVCCLSISNFNNLGHYFSDRLLMCMASGRPTISLTFPGWESYFTNNVNIVMVDSVYEIPKKVYWLMQNPDIANNIGRAGAEIVTREHTYGSRAKELLHMVGLL